MLENLKREGREGREESTECQRLTAKLAKDISNILSDLKFRAALRKLHG